MEGPVKGQWKGKAVERSVEGPVKGQWKAWRKASGSKAVEGPVEGQWKVQWKAVEGSAGLEEAPRTGDHGSSWEIMGDHGRGSSHRSSTSLVSGR